jgi:hypothetical protein
VPPFHGWSTLLLRVVASAKIIHWLVLLSGEMISLLDTHIPLHIQGADALLALFRTSVLMRA